MKTTGQPVTKSATTASWRARRLDADRSLGLRLTVAALAAFLVLVPFALLAILVVSAWPPLFELDRSVSDTLHGYALANPGWVTFMSWWTDIFAPMPLRGAALVLFGWLFFVRDNRRLAAWVAVTVLVGGSLSALLKLIVGRARPELLDPVASAPGFAFPSGHALNATVAAGVLLLVFLPFVRHRRGLRWLLWSAAVLLAVVTGFSRIALGVHWVSDVLAGWLLGVAVVAATSAGFATWRSRIGRRPASNVREGVEPEAVEPGDAEPGHAEPAAAAEAERAVAKPAAADRAAARRAGAGQARRQA